jgi:hypothetical protein
MMRHEDFTEEDYLDLVRYMKVKIPGLSVVSKDDTIEMALILEGLKKIEPLVGSQWISADDWLNRYALALGTRAYIPKGWSPAQKAEALVHECQHVLQFLDKQYQSDIAPGLEFMWLYLSWGQARVRCEVEAYRAGQMEFRYGLFGHEIPIDQMVAPLEGSAYLLSSEDQSLARSLLEVAGTTVYAGVSPSTKAGQLGLQWAAERGLL